VKPCLTKLRLKLLQSGITQKELAARAAISTGYISLIVTGRLLPNPEQKKRIAAILGVKVTQLWSKST
jgi:transcriptional regulator with XRE-family HTH domain